MSITWGEVKSQVRALMDEYSSRGALLPTTKVADVLNKMRFFVNPILYDLASTTAKLSAVQKITINPVLNDSLTDTSSIKKHLPGVDADYFLVGAKSCFFEVSGPATITIAEETSTDTWTTIETITVASTVTELTEYRRLIATSDANNKIRLRFGGDYAYDYRNYILYPYTWPAEASVQQHRPKFVFDLPTDYLLKNKVKVKKDTRHYSDLPTAKYDILEDKGKILIDRYIAPAEVENWYWRKPTLIDPMTAADDTILDTTDDAAQIVFLGVAARTLVSEKDETAGVLARNDYEVLKANLVSNEGTYLGTVISSMEW